MPGGCLHSIYRHRVGASARPDRVVNELKRAGTSAPVLFRVLKHDDPRLGAEVVRRRARSREIRPTFIARDGVRVNLAAWRRWRSRLEHSGLVGYRAAITICLGVLGPPRSR